MTVKEFAKCTKVPLALNSTNKIITNFMTPEISFGYNTYTCMFSTEQSLNMKNNFE